MMAIRLVKDLKKATGIEYPLSALFSAPTIRQLVAGVGEAAERAASIVHLNAARVGTPIYCLAGVQLYKELADQFTNRPVFGIYAKRELAGIQAQDAGFAVNLPISELVQTYADAVSRHATQKKLVLLGLSFGGLMALEVAAELNRRGFEVSQVALLDTIPAGAYTRSYRKALKDCAQRLTTGNPVETLKDLWGRVYTRLAATAPNSIARLRRRRTGGRRGESVQGQAFRQMNASYNPDGKSYQLNAILIKAMQKTFGIGASLKPDYGFGNIIKGRLDIAAVDADHRGMLDGEACLHVYQILSGFLEPSQVQDATVVPLAPFVERRAVSG
jgi:thioesterase domain-containing protein